MNPIQTLESCEAGRTLKRHIAPFSESDDLLDLMNEAAIKSVDELHDTGRCRELTLTIEESREINRNKMAEIVDDELGPVLLGLPIPGTTTELRMTYAYDGSGFMEFRNVADDGFAEFMKQALSSDSKLLEGWMSDGTSKREAGGQMVTALSTLFLKQRKRNVIVLTSDEFAERIGTLLDFSQAGNTWAEGKRVLHQDKELSPLGMLELIESTFR